VPDLTPDGDRVFPGSPTHLRGWDDWLKAFEDDADAGVLERYEQEQALQKLVLTHMPEACDTESSEIHWLEKHVAQAQIQGEKQCDS
jgi:hypothetical protein